MFETVDYNKFNDLLMVHYSCVMEGSMLSFHDTEMLITYNITPEGKPLEYFLMTSDHYAALLKVNELANDAKLKFSHALIKDIAAAVMPRTGDKVNTPLGTYDKALGEYQLNNVRSTGGHYYINYDKVQARMDKLVQTVNDALPKVQSPDDVFALASYTHLEFLTIHPIGDGNGRTARLLNNLILLNKKMPTLVIDAVKKGKYIEAIKTSREQETINAFNDFLKAEYLEYCERELSLYQKKDSGEAKDSCLSFFELTRYFLITIFSYAMKAEATLCQFVGAHFSLFLILR